MKTQKFFAVRVVVTHDNGGTSQRDYVRGDMHLGRQAFTSFAVGDMLGLLSGWNYGDTNSVTVQEIDFLTVQENRVFHHTTH